jgi:hypothetical protein
MHGQQRQNSERIKNQTNESYSLLLDHLMIHIPQSSSFFLFTTLLIQSMGEVLTHQSIARPVACVVVFD